MKEVLTNLDDHAVYLPGYGNAGDALISAGTFELFKQIQLTYSVVSRAQLSDVDRIETLVIGGGGGWFVSNWSDQEFLTNLIKKTGRLIFLPQSVNGCLDILKLLREQDILILREKTSYDFCISSELNCRILLDDDLALSFNWISISKVKKRKFKETFRVSELRYCVFYLFNYLNSRLSKKLIAMRSDSESVQNFYKSRFFMDISNSSFVTQGSDSEEAIYRSSLRFLKIINFYDEVITDRLHVAIGGYLLGKRVSVLDQSYGKISAVNSFSSLNFKILN